LVTLHALVLYRKRRKIDWRQELLMLLSLARPSVSKLVYACLLLSVSTASAQSILPLGEILQRSQAQAPAAVQALNASTLSAQITAVVTEIGVDLGDSVAQSDLLVALDDVDYQLALRRAQVQKTAAAARLELAGQRLARARELSTRGFASADDLLARSAEQATAQADLRSAELAEDSARRDLQRARIVAPFDGVVRARHAQLGQLATPGMAMVELVSDSDVEVRARVQVSDAPGLQLAESLRFETLAGSFPVELLSVTPLVDAGSRTREARLRFSGELLPPGTEGRLLWLQPQGMIPANWLLRRNGELGIFVVEDQRARFVALPGAQEGRPAYVDLPASTLIAAQGRDALQDGDRVQP
jgi:RND family efflux transporter MFP subunit